MEDTHPLDRPGVRALLGSELGVSTQAITNWKAGRIPADRCPDIEALTGIKCEELRPDVNWAVLRKKPLSSKRRATPTTEGA